MNSSSVSEDVPIRVPSRSSDESIDSAFHPVKDPQGTMNDSSSFSNLCFIQTIAIHYAAVSSHARNIGQKGK